jgi:hypothetical protein
MQKVVTMQDKILPEFDKNRRINRQNVLVLDNNNVNYDIILSTNLLYDTGFKSKYPEGRLDGFTSPSHFVHLEVWIQTNLMQWKTCFTSKPKTRSLVKIDSKALQQRFWMPSMKRQM